VQEGVVIISPEEFNSPLTPRMRYVLSRETVGPVCPLVGPGMAFPERDMALDFSIGGGYLALANCSII